MAQRRALMALAGGLGGGLEAYGNTMLGEIMKDRASQRTLTRTLIKDYADRVAKGELDPDQAEAAMAQQGAKVPKGYFSKNEPSVQSRLSGVLNGVESADSLTKVPSPTALATSMGAKRIPLITPGTINPDTGENSSRLSDQLMQTLGVRNDKMDSFPATRVPGIYDAGTGATREDFIPAREATQARSFQTSPTPNQKGFNTSEEKSTELTRASELGIPEETARQFTRTAAGERGAKAADAYATTDATHRASEPWQEHFATFSNNLPTLETVNEPITGNESRVTVRKGTGEVAPIAMPAGLEPGKAKQIPATIADNTAGINTAEIEGVKILRALRASGLQDSNNIMDPRWNQFVVNVLHASPEDWNTADMQQRIGFVNANLTRALMGSRPSQYVAQTIIQPHLPKQDQSFMALGHVLNNVLQQAQERRAEFAKTLGVPIERLNPTGGSYADYMKEFGVATDAAPMFTVVNGQVVPIQRR